MSVRFALDTVYVHNDRQATQWTDKRTFLKMSMAFCIRTLANRERLKVFPGIMVGQYK
jgi:hypothetical protein